jgi:hypothetical protein
LEKCDCPDLASREDGLKQLAEDLSAAISKARELNLPTTVYILSMALLEVTEVLRRQDEGGEDGSAG